MSKKKFVIVRSSQAGCFAGYVKKRTGPEIELTDAIRLWYWDGAASLSQLAAEGTRKPARCKFGVPVSVLLRWDEVIDTTEEARKSIQGVSPWRA